MPAVTTQRLLDTERPVPLQLACALQAAASVTLRAPTRRAAAPGGPRSGARLRRSLRAGEAWILLVGLAPLGLDQVMDAIGISRRGTYALSAALTETGLGERQSRQGKVLLVATERAKAIETPGPVFSGALGTAVDAFDDAMADLDRLLARTGNQGGDGT